MHVSIHPLVKAALIFFGVLTAQQVLRARRNRDRSVQQKHAAVQAWESEGGAVPVSNHRTAAVVTPTAASEASR